ncbi:MAG: PEP-CTERM sorting domain-containing protein [Terriglobia bacterium]
MHLKYLAIGIVVAVAPLSASAIYSNLGPGQSYLSAGFFSSSGSNPLYQGTEFIATSSANLSTVLVPVESTDGLLTFGLYSDSSGTPGTLLESWSSVTVPTNFSTFSLTTLTSVVNPLLSSGDTYWFLSSTVPSDGPRSLGWESNNQSIAGGLWAGSSPTGLSQVNPASPAPAIELDSATSTSTTPEPASWLMVAAGLIGSLYWRRRSVDSKAR